MKVEKVVRLPQNPIPIIRRASLPKVPPNSIEYIRKPRIKLPAAFTSKVPVTPGVKPEITARSTAPANPPAAINTKGFETCRLTLISLIIHSVLNNTGAGLSQHTTHRYKKECHCVEK